MDELVKAGVRRVLSLACERIRMPENITVVYVLIGEFAGVIAHRTCELERKRGGKEEVMKTKKAADVMTANVITARPDMKLTEAMNLLLRWHISGLPVVDEDGQLQGIISEIDLVNLTFDGNAGDTEVKDIMTTTVTSFGPEADISDLVHCFSKQHLRRVPVLEDGKVIGIVSRRDLLREILRLYDRY